jgi:S1-C subfamily serine protease
MIAMLLRVCALLAPLLLAHAANAERPAYFGEQEYKMLRNTVAVTGPERINSAGRLTQLTGSGVLISSTEVLTAAHIASEHGLSMRIATYDGEEIRGMVVWVDLTLDLALIKIEKALPQHFFSRSAPIRAGETIRVIGHPGHIPWVMSTGVIIWRNEEVLVPYGEELRLFTLIVTSAPTKEGGSGGALVDIEGNLLGVVLISHGPYSWAGAQSIVNFCRAHWHPICLQ